MIEKILESKNYNNEDFSDNRLQGNKYEACTFKHCNFTDAHLSGKTFMDCRFEDCDFSLAKIKDTAFKSVQFVHCKLVGLKFADCNDFLISFNFEHCNLDYATFRELKIPKTIFVQCALQQADFSHTNLNSSVFEQCNLANTIFDGTVLEKVDFSSSFNYVIDPSNNKLSQARFASTGLKGLLHNYDIIID
jgi:uncharacterized protein YjbI with pentapeptide repeats